MVRYYTLTNQELHPIQNFRTGVWVHLTDAREVEHIIQQVSPARSVFATLYLENINVKIIFTDKCVITVSDIEEDNASLAICMKAILTTLFCHEYVIDTNVNEMMELFYDLSSVEIVADDHFSFTALISYIEKLSELHDAKSIFMVIYANSASTLDHTAHLAEILEQVFPKAKIQWTILLDDSRNSIYSMTMLGK